MDKTYVSIKEEKSKTTAYFSDILVNSFFKYGEFVYKKMSERSGTIISSAERSDTIPFNPNDSVTQIKQIEIIYYI